MCIVKTYYNMAKIVELGFIYYLQNPITKEIFYIGSTQQSLKQRLRTHYIHLSEAISGKRKMNKRYEYLLNLEDNKAEIHLLQIVTNDCLDKAEKFHIKHFRQVNPNLTNMTDGGAGGFTGKYYTIEEREKLGHKIRGALKGIKKPAGFAENLSKQRKGLGNPAAKEMQVGWIVANEETLFKYTFEIDEYIGKKAASSNVIKNLKKGNRGTPYGVKWTFFSDMNKKKQDIVHSSYENKRVKSKETLTNK